MLTVLKRVGAKINGVIVVSIQYYINKVKRLSGLKNRDKIMTVGIRPTVESGSFSDLAQKNAASALGTYVPCLKHRGAALGALSTLVVTRLFDGPISLDSG